MLQDLAAMPLRSSGVFASRGSAPTARSARAASCRSGRPRTRRSSLRRRTRASPSAGGVAREAGLCCRAWMKQETKAGAVGARCLGVAVTCGLRVSPPPGHGGPCLATVLASGFPAGPRSASSRASPSFVRHRLIYASSRPSSSCADSSFTREQACSAACIWQHGAAINCYSDACRQMLAKDRTVQHRQQLGACHRGGCHAHQGLSGWANQRTMHSRTCTPIHERLPEAYMSEQTSGDGGVEIDIPPARPAPQRAALWHRAAPAGPRPGLPLPAAPPEGPEGG